MSGSTVTTSEVKPYMLHPSVLVLEASRKNRRFPFKTRLLVPLNSRVTNYSNTVPPLKTHFSDISSDTEYYKFKIICAVNIAKLEGNI